MDRVLKWVRTVPTLQDYADAMVKGSPSEWAATIAGMTFVGFAVWVMMRCRQWWRDDDDPAATDAQMLIHLRELKERGEITEEEYRSVRSRVSIDATSNGPASVNTESSRTPSSLTDSGEPASNEVGRPD